MLDREEGDNPSESFIQHELIVSIKGSGLQKRVAALPDSGNGDSTYEGVSVGIAAKDLLIDYINKETSSGGYFKGVGEHRMELMRGDIQRGLSKFLGDSTASQTTQKKRLYDDKGIADDITIVFERVSTRIGSNTI